MRPQPRPVRLADVLPDGVAPPQGDAVVTGMTLDSRAVLPGDLYAALPGHVTHGANFAGDAVRAGAAAILTDADGAASSRELGVPVIVVDDPRRHVGSIAASVYGQPARSLQMLGVTGTNGKTTVASMIEAGLRAAGRSAGLIGTVGVNVAGVRHAGVRTTPEAPDLHAILAVMRDEGVTSVVMEVSSIAMSESRIDGIHFDIVGFTQLTQDHLDYHGTMEDYFAAKAQLFTPARADRAVIGVDDEWGRRLASMTEIPVQTWSLLDPQADWHATRGRDVRIVDPDGASHALDVPLAGAFNVANAVLAYAMLREAGVFATDALAGIASVEVPGRMQRVDGRVRGIVDYAHSPDAIERVIRAARELPDVGRVIVVVGAGGDRDRSKRPMMGEVAARLADVLVVTDDNPRSEDPQLIRSALREGALRVMPGERAEVREVADRREAITVAVGLGQAGDVVLVLGKGHEQGQEVAGVVTEFDDATELHRALAAAS